MRRLISASAVAGVAVVVLTGLAGPAAGTETPSAQSGGETSETAVLHDYAARTWASMAAMTDVRSGLPADSLGDDGVRSVQTSTTNIGAYLWSAVAARNIGLISSRELVTRLSATLRTLEGMDRDAASGQFFNWYNATSGAVLTTWPPTGEPLTPILSSVDNAWLATGLRVVRGSVPQLSTRAQKLYASMDFGTYYRPDVNRIAFHIVPSTGESPCCYDTVVSESRMASYLGIANGQLPPKEYFGAWRAFPATCDYSFQETKPSGPTHTYLGQTVFDGSYEYAGLRITPSWGGSAFEDLMPSLFMPEERWAPRSWGSNHPNTVKAQIHHGLVEAGYGYWGFSPSNNPDGGYSVYGVDAVGSNPEGYPSDNGNTLVDHGFAGCPGRDAKPDPPASAYTGGVVTPHASFLALRFDRPAALANLARLRSHFDVYSRWGFRDAVDVTNGRVSPAYLSLDQGIIMAALGKPLGAQPILKPLLCHGPYIMVNELMEQNYVDYNFAKIRALQTIADFPIWPGEPIGFMTHTEEKEQSAATTALHAAMCSTLGVDAITTASTDEAFSRGSITADGRVGALRSIEEAFRFFGQTDIAPTAKANQWMEELIVGINQTLKAVAEAPSFVEALYQGILGNKEDGVYPGRAGRNSVSAGTHPASAKALNGALVPAQILPVAKQR